MPVKIKPGIDFTLFHLLPGVTIISHPVSIRIEGLGIKLTCISYVDQMDFCIIVDPILVLEPCLLDAELHNAIAVYSALIKPNSGPGKKLRPYGNPHSTMQSKRSRLDRYLSDRLSINRGDVRLLLAQGRVKLDYQTARDIQQFVDQYTHVQFDSQVLQANIPNYVMLHKPGGVVSATKDASHSTVVDLLPEGYPEDLHIVGRLDYNSTGLVLLTNDGRWSRRLTQPESRVAKRYRVSLDKPIGKHVIAAFSEGIYFKFENLTTRPAGLSIIDDHNVEVMLEEGRYHQIKRMFGRFQIEVLKLHRYGIGSLLLEDNLQQGHCRNLTPQEVLDIFNR